MIRRSGGSAPPLSPAFHEGARKIIARYPPGRERSALLPLLYLAQSEHGYVSADAMGEIAGLLEMTKAEVAAVQTFYTMFKRHPQGRWLVSICTQPSCTLAGANEIKARLEADCGISCGGTTSDGLVSLEEVECLCACDGAPVVSVNYENYEKIDAEYMASIVATLRSGGSPPPAARGDTPEDFAAVNRRMSGLEAPR
jgi:NADH-quinone oxidoreductase subunit E